jgi:hypothetical protein
MEIDLETEEDSAIRKGLRRYVVSLMNKSVKLVRQIDNKPEEYRFLVGKAVAYYLSARDLAKTTGMNIIDYPVFANLSGKLSDLALKAERPAPVKTVTVQHKRDPGGVKVDRDKLDFRKAIEEARKSKLHEIPKENRMPNHQAKVFGEVTKVLKKLGFSESEAHCRVTDTYIQGASVEELVIAACR